MKLLRSDAGRMAVIGVMLFALSQLWGGAETDDVGLEERPRITIRAQRLAMVQQVFLQENGRFPTPAENAELVDALIDQEVLYRYAIKLGMHRSPVAEQRLAQIAAFVEANPHEVRTDGDLALEAVELGLHEGDMVVRRILADAARRLIRAVVLARRPTRAKVEEFLDANRELFMRPERIRITHVAVNGFKWGDPEKRGRELLRRIEGEALAPSAAAALGDEPFVPAELPLLTYQSIHRRFGADFEKALREAPQESWYGPVRSRYGYHLVWVHERRPPHLPPLDVIGPRVEQRLLEKVADEWLKLRLVELRSEFDIDLPKLTS
jgi:hypothetical protein